MGYALLRVQRAIDHSVDCPFSIRQLNVPVESRLQVIYAPMFRSATSCKKTPELRGHSLFNRVQTAFRLILLTAPHQTTPPSISRVSTTAADGVPRGVAGRSQTIDVYGSPRPLASGGFRLSYGHDDGVSSRSSGSSSSGITSSIGSSTSSGISRSGDGIFTECIPANSTLLSADVVAEALFSANDFLNVTVTENEPPFGDARRFVVHFDSPVLGVGVLGVVDADDDCGWIRCDDGEDEDGDGDGIRNCEESGVLVNRDASVAVQEGAIEVWMMSMGTLRAMGTLFHVLGGAG